jgi:hypothetical protein
MQVIFYANIHRVIFFGAQDVAHIYIHKVVHTRTYGGLIDSITHLLENLCQVKKIKNMCSSKLQRRCALIQVRSFFFYVFVSVFIFYFLFACRVLVQSYGCDVDTPSNALRTAVCTLTPTKKKRSLKGGGGGG